jgi:GTP cyclohydrolase I
MSAQDRAPAPLVDIQSSPDTRGIPLRAAGISRLRYPMVVWDKANQSQHTVGLFTLTVDLPHHYKGTHMSRFIAALERHRGEISLGTLPGLVQDLRVTLNAERAHARVEFPYFVTRRAPESGSESLLELHCSFLGDADGQSSTFTLGVDVPVMTLCPCSKAISRHGAHCQRSTARMRVRFNDLIWIEELVAIADASASAPIFPLLKRADEKWVTERSYENPVFVEDLVRNIALRLKADPRIDWFEVEAENEESIHAHNAFAAVGSDDLVAATGEAPSPGLGGDDD